MTQPSRYVHLHGRIVPEEEARISPFDRGFLLGDGVFETMRAYGGRALDLEAHLARLRRSCELTRLPFPEGIAEAIGETLDANALADAAVRVTVTRGPGGRGASPHGAGPATVLVTATPIPYAAETYARGLRLATSARRRVTADALEPGVMSVNYLVHVLARAEAEEAGADDALFVDAHGDVVEATQANVFAVFGDELAAPHLASGCLPGISRDVVLALAREAGLRPRERPLARAELDRADEVFLTGSVLEVCGVVALDGRPVGAGAPGPRTRALHALYRKRALAADAEE
jgi:branched-chain amino acid aminotransferase